MEKLYTVTKTRPGADCGSDHEHLITKFRLKLKKVGKTTRPFRYDLNQIPYNYTVRVSHSVLPNSLRPHGLQPSRLLCPWDFPGKNAGVCCHFLLQGIFLTQGSNPGLLRCRQILYQLNYKGSDYTVEVTNRYKELDLIDSAWRAMDRGL